MQVDSDGTSLFFPEPTAKQGIWSCWQLTNQNPGIWVLELLQNGRLDMISSLILKFRIDKIIHLPGQILPDFCSSLLSALPRDKLK